MSAFRRYHLLFLLLWLVSSSGWVFAAPDGVSFSRDIQPLLAQKCLECHGPDKQKGGLRLDIREDATKALESGERAISPHRPDASELLRRVLSDDPDLKMPPKGDRLTSAAADSFRAWIREGAPYSQHWAYAPLSRAPIPVVKDSAWGHNPIDRFVLARLEQDGIVPSPEAERPILIKRLYYDLIGLPPTPAQVAAFIADTAPDAYEKVIDELLRSRHFGERWGRHWLDMARYADSDGYEKDRPRPDAWHYRDWVIEAVNADMPFDQFTREQLAGDLLPGAAPGQRLATAFHRQTLTNTEGGTDQEQFRNEAVFDRVETTSAVWLGLTVGCARCHSHKYDAITQREYYQLFDFYNNGDETTYRLPPAPEGVAAYEKAKTAHEEKAAVLKRKMEAATLEAESAQSAWENIQRQAEPQSAAAWHDLHLVSATASVSGVTLTPEKDGSLLAGGENPEGPVDYLLEFEAEVLKPLTGLRIEAITDPRLPGGGPGRMEGGNFVLSELSATLAGKPIAFASATADFSQKGWDVGTAFDGNLKTGWGTSPQRGKSHHADFRFTNPVSAISPTRISVTLRQHYGQQHTLGRLRVQGITGDPSALPPPAEILVILALPPEARNPGQQKQLREYFQKKVHQPTMALADQLDQLAKAAPKPPGEEVRVLVQRAAEPRLTRILDRGDFLTPKEEVHPGGLSTLAPVTFRQDGRADRLDLANWLMDERNPLTPRVLVNQIWAHLFGEGIVRTINDFGVRGDPPTHPELLDWLAAEYRRQGWSRKALLRLILQSATYRQSSRHRPELNETDPTNRFLARQNRLRVQAEIVRDIGLSLSGLLSDKVGGPSVFPPMPAEVAALSYAGNFKWDNSTGADRYRRGLYTFFKRTSPHPNLMTFDCPDSNTTTISRQTSNTPLQALTLLNNETFAEASQALAVRALGWEVADDASRVTLLLRHCVAREPASAETSLFLDLLRRSKVYYDGHAEEASTLTARHRAPNRPVSESAAWTAVARIALNLDEVITRD